MKNYIKRRLREDLEYHHVSDATQDEYVLNEEVINNNLRKEYIKLGMESQFTTAESANEELNNTIGMLKKLPQNVTLYRVIFVDDENDIDSSKIGSHYVLKQSDLEASHAIDSHVGGGQPILLTIKAPKNLIDVDATLRHRMQFPHEKEITLKNKGLGAKIIRTQPFVGSDDINDLIGTPGDFGGFGEFN